MTTSYAYLHCKPDGTPFYVGKGTLRRARYYGDRNPHHKRVVDKYGAKNLLCGVMECSNAATAYELERGLIKCLRRSGVVLANYTAGGDGGRDPTPETRARLSAAAKKRGVSAACHEARMRAKLGKPLSVEQREKLRQRQLGKVFTEAHRENIRKSAQKRGVSPCTREAQRLAVSKPVWVDGTLFASAKAAADFVGCTPPAIGFAIRNTGIVKGHSVRRHHDD